MAPGMEYDEIMWDRDPKLYDYSYRNRDGELETIKTILTLVGIFMVLSLTMIVW